jgi:hypothetical protein
MHPPPPHLAAAHEPFRIRRRDSSIGLSRDSIGSASVRPSVRTTSSRSTGCWHVVLADQTVSGLVITPGRSPLVVPP